MYIKTRSVLGAVVVLLCALLVTGCVNNPAPTHINDQQVDLVVELQKAARELLRATNGLASDKPILTTTLVSIDNLQQSSTFGRQATEVFSSEIGRRGIPVVELKMRDTIFIREGTGELTLSRELRHLYTAHDAQAILAGTYAIGGNQVYVNVRLIKTTDNIILGSHNFSLPMNRDVRAMLSHR